MPRYTFEEIATTRRKTWVEDGKKRQKTRKFRQTVNPFNKTKDGEPKSRDQIFKEVHAEADAWVNSDERE